MKIINGIRIVDGDYIEKVVRYPKKYKGLYAAAFYDDSGEECGYVAVANNNGEALTEEFKKPEKAIEWLKCHE